MKKTTVKNKLRKKRSTFKNKLRKTSKKNKNLIGGYKPKITFPYTYYYVTRADLETYKHLNSYINIQTKYCNWTTTDPPDEIIEFDMPAATANMTDNFLAEADEILIIFVRYDIADKLIKDQIIAGHPTATTYFNDLNFLNDQILGHAKIIKYPTVDILGIYNICVHKITIPVESDLRYEPKPQKTDTAGKVVSSSSGTVLISCTILAIAFIPFSFTGKTFKYLWLGIDLENLQFEKLVHMYTSIGFKYPSISNIMPNGEKIEGEMMIMQFFKEITNYTNNINDTIIPEMEALDLFDQYNYTTDNPDKLNLAKKGIFYYNFSLDKSAILSLRMLPYLSFTDDVNMNVKGINTFDEQVETSGTLILNNIEDKYDKGEKYNFITHVLSLEPISKDNSSIKFNKGDREQKAVIVTPEQRSFHTHPYIMYDHYKTIMGPPSGGDCKVFVNDVMNYMYDTKKSAIQEHHPAQLPVQLRLVVAIEGIYVMSMTETGIEYLKNNSLAFGQWDGVGRQKFINGFSDATETLGKTTIRQKFVWADHRNETIDPEMVNNEIAKYLVFINELKFNDVNIIKVKFFSWKDIKPNKIIAVQYYNGNNIMKSNTTQFQPRPQQQQQPPPIFGQQQQPNRQQQFQPNRQQQQIIGQQPNRQPPPIFGQQQQPNRQQQQIIGQQPINILPQQKLTKEEQVKQRLEHQQRQRDITG
jgi:hypothetical protein